MSSLHAFRKCAKFNACLPQQHLKNFGRVPFWVKHKIFGSHPPTLMRKVEDPLWDLGVGFGQVPDRGRHLVLPWEQPAFSFLSGASGSAEDLSRLLQQPNPFRSLRCKRSSDLTRFPGCASPSLGQWRTIRLQTLRPNVRQHSPNGRR